MNPFSRTIINGVLDIGHSLPSRYRLFYSRTPNNWLDVGWEDDFGWDSDLSAWSIPRTVTDWTGTERDMFTILGVGLFFDASGNSLAVSGTQILAWVGINQYHVLYHPTRGLAVYDPATATEATINKARKFMRDDRLLDDPDVLSLIPNAYPFTDSKGIDRTMYPLQYIEAAANLDLRNASIVSTETVTAKQGTATVTVAAGKLTVGAGTLWSWALSNGSSYEFGTILSATTGVCFDTSGNGRHLTFTVANTSVVCKSGREDGSDYLNIGGYTVADGSQYLSAVSFGLIADGVVIPNLSSGSGCCAYVVGG